MYEPEYVLDEFSQRSAGSGPYYDSICRSMVAVLRGDERKSIEEIGRAIDGFVALGDRLGEARAHAKACIVYRTFGQVQSLENEARLALELFREQSEPASEASVLLELGQLRLAHGQADAALRLFEHGLARLGKYRAGEEERLTTLRAFLSDVAANCLAEKGKWTRAKNLRHDAIRAYERLNQAHLRRDQVITWSNIAIDSINTGAAAEAESALIRAKNILAGMENDKVDDPECRGSYETACGQFLNALIRRKPNDRSRLEIEFTGESIRTTSSGPTRSELLELTRRCHKRAIACWRRMGKLAKELRVTLNLGQIELELGDPELAALELRRATGIAARIDPGDGVAIGQKKELEKLWQRLPPGKREVSSDPAAERCDIGAEIAFVWADLESERALREVEKQKSGALLDVMRHHHHEGDEDLVKILSELGEKSDQIPVRPAHRNGMREAFVDYFLGEDATLAFLELAGESIRCFKLDISRNEVDAAVQRMRQSFDGGPMHMPILPENPEEVRLDYIDELGRRLMPFVDELKGVDITCVFPHGALHSFPFAAIHLADGTALIEHTAVVYALSRRTLAIARSTSNAKAGWTVSPRSALAVGVPALNEEEPAAFLGEGAFLESLGVACESLETSEDATVENVVSQFGKYDLVHFNCHGLFSASSPLDSCLLLSDGKGGPSRSTLLADPNHGGRLNVRKLFRLRVDTGTVVLRACSSGVTNVREGDEQEGLLRALIHMGVATCVVARWKIDTRSSRDLIRTFYKAWLMDKSPKGIALQRAQIAMLSDKAHPFYHHPFHWAPFTLVGDWR